MREQAANMLVEELREQIQPIAELRYWYRIHRWLVDKNFPQLFIDVSGNLLLRKVDEIIEANPWLQTISLAEDISIHGTAKMEGRSAEMTLENLLLWEQGVKRRIQSIKDRK